MILKKYFHKDREKMENKAKVSSKKIVTCPACHSSFKLQDHIPIRKNRISCIKCNQPIMLVFTYTPSEIIEDNPDDMKGIMYEYIERYYKPKNHSLKIVIKEVCNAREFRLKGTFAEFTPNSSERDIKYKIESLLSDKEDIINQSFGWYGEGKYVVKFYEDLQKFRVLFSKKGLKTTYKEILSIFVDVIAKEERKEHEDEIYSIVKKRVNGKKEEQVIIKAYIEYLLETNEDFSINKIGKLKKACKEDLPELLRRFGFQFKEFEGELNDFYQDVIDKLREENDKKQKQAEEIQADAFEKELDSSYDDLEISYEDDEYDDDLLSDYLDEDN